MIHNDVCPYCGRFTLKVGPLPARVENDAVGKMRLVIPFTCICGWNAEEVYKVNYENTVTLKFPPPKFNPSTLVKVDSSVIQAVGYDRQTSILGVVFRSNPKVYLYKDVDAVTFIDFLNAESKGTFFSKSIRGQYQRVD